MQWWKPGSYKSTTFTCQCTDDKTLSIPEATYKPCPTLISVDALKRLNSNQHLKGGCIFAGKKDLERTIEMLIPKQNRSFFHKLLTEPAALLSLSRLLTCHAAVGSDDFKRRSSASLSHPSKSMSISCGKIWCVTRWPFHELHCHYFITCRFWKYYSAQLNTR